MHLVPAGHEVPSKEDSDGEMARQRVTGRALSGDACALPTPLRFPATLIVADGHESRSAPVGHKSRSPNVFES